MCKGKPTNRIEGKLHDIKKESRLRSWKREYKGTWQNITTLGISYIIVIYYPRKMYVVSCRILFNIKLFDERSPAFHWHYVYVLEATTYIGFGRNNEPTKSHPIPCPHGHAVIGDLPYVTWRCRQKLLCIFFYSIRNIPLG